MPQRKIIHIDMDAFFASVEQRDFPELRGKPVAVGGNSGRGVVAAASYEARVYGVRSAMPGRMAAKLCPDLVFVNHRFDVYKEVSQQIREIFHEYTDLVEPLSLDEAYLDVTENKPGYKSAIFIAREIKDKIKRHTQLTASAGVSVNKFLAKIASDMDKPDGLYVIMPEEVEKFVENLPVKKFYGVGKATLARMEKLNIHTGKDLKALSKLDLALYFGKFGTYLYDVCRGEDHREVKSNRERKSFSIERTYEHDKKGRESILQALNVLCEKLAASLNKRAIKGKTFNLKVRYEDFTTLTRSKSLTGYFNEEEVLKEISEELIEEFMADDRGIRLLGVGLSNLYDNNNDPQLKLEL
jgi:DNA polymerase-4